jgi:hypothetical protein
MQEQLPRDVFYRAYRDVLVACLRGQVHVSRRSVGTELQESTGDSQDAGGTSQDSLQVRPCKLFKNVHVFGGLGRYPQHPANCASLNVLGFENLL